MNRPFNLGNMEILTWLVPVFCVAIWLLALVILIADKAHSKEAYSGQYENVNPRVKDWYGSLKNKAGMVCCDVADCHMTEMAYKDGKYYAFLPDGRPLEIPERIIVEEKYEQTNPTGSAVVCYTPIADNPYEDGTVVKPSGDPNRDYIVRCFVRGLWT